MSPHDTHVTEKSFQQIVVASREQRPDIRLLIAGHQSKKHALVAQGVRKLLKGQMAGLEPNAVCAVFA